MEVPGIRNMRSNYILSTPDIDDSHHLHFARKIKLSECFPFS